MSIPKWKVALEDLGLSAPTPADPPEGRSGVWLNALTRFERRGFVRILVRDAERIDWYVESAHPALTSAAMDVVTAALTASSGTKWTFEPGGESHFILEGSMDDGRARESLVPLLLFADAVAADRNDLGDLLARMTDLAESESADEDNEAAAESNESNESETQDAPSDHGENEQPDSVANSPFETIGSGDSEPDASHPIFDLRVADDYIEVGMGLAHQLDSATFDLVVDAWSRSLRGRYDVRVEEVAPDADWAVDLDGALARVVLRVRPDALTGSVTIADIGPDLRDHMDTLEKVSAAGIDPLVFLGVRERSSRSIDAEEKRKSPSSSSFESIGSDDAEPDDGDTEGHQPEESEPNPVLFVAEAPEDEGGGLILDLSAPPSDDDPLEAGRFSDPRLKVPDATTSLVDVVLRHPGYSDRRIGQVLSILLSIDYADALDLANSAPRVMAWGVGQQRGQTMKTVVEGAGGKVLLVEPGTFSAR